MMPMMLLRPEREVGRGETKGQTHSMNDGTEDRLLNVGWWPVFSLISINYRNLLLFFEKKSNAA